MKKITLLIVLLLAIDFSYGQILTFDFNGNVGNEASVNSNSNDAGLTFSTITRGAGLSANNNANSFNSQDWALTSIANAVAGNNYVEFTLTPNTGFQFDVTTIIIDFYRSGTGVRGLALRSSVDSYSTDIDSEKTVIDNTNLQSFSFTVSQSNNNTAVTYRLYGWSELTGGSGRFESGGNDIEVNGAVSPLNSCASVSTWDGTSWDVAPSSTAVAVIDGNYTATTANSLSVCGLYINAVSTITGNPVIVRVDNGGYIEVQNDVTVDGTLIVETQGNFVQRGNTGTFTNNGISRVNKTTANKADWFYYTYWSSPVVGETVEDAFPNVDGDRRFWFNAANFIDTDGDDIDDDANDWQAASGTMLPGVGYASTEARLFSAFAPATGTASFEGIFNTRDVGVTISENAANVAVGSTSWNFIGNPYPSAIDFNAFHAANSTVVGGAAYFWSQVTDPDESNSGNEDKNFSKNDYAIYTVASGGVVAGAGGIMPDQYIPSSQGFFIAGIDNNTATFTNAMRMADGTSNAQFFRNSSSKKKTANPNTNRLWVNLTTDNGVFNQILVAYVDGATNGNDGLSYDAPRIVSGDYAAILYSSMDSFLN